MGKGHCCHFPLSGTVTVPSHLERARMCLGSCGCLWENPIFQLQDLPIPKVTSGNREEFSTQIFLLIPRSSRQDGLADQVIQSALNRVSHFSARTQVRRLGPVVPGFSLQKKIKSKVWIWTGKREIQLENFFPWCICVCVCVWSGSDLLSLKA